MTLEELSKLTPRELNDLLRGVKNYCDICNKKIRWECIRRGDGSPLCDRCARKTGYFPIPPWER
jgi:hypothetical protein